MIFLRVGKGGTGTALLHQAGIPASSNVLLFFDIFVTHFSVTRLFFRFMFTD